MPAGGIPLEAEVTAICGEVFVSHEDGIGTPVCPKCAAIILDELHTEFAKARDMDRRLADVAQALALKDELGQTNWLHHTTEEAIANAFWRPGPARPEGPEREDGGL